VARVGSPVVTSPFRHSSLRAAEAIPPTCGTRQTDVPQVALRSVAVLLGGRTPLLQSRVRTYARGQPRGQF